MLCATKTFKKQTKSFTNYACFCSATMLTSKIITEIIEKHSEFSVWVNSCNKLFKVDLDKSRNYLWYCYQKAPPPLSPFWKVRREMPPLSRVPEEFMVWHVVKSAQLWNLESPECQLLLLRIERSHLLWFGHVSRMSRVIDESRAAG